MRTSSLAVLRCLRDAIRLTCDCGVAADGRLPALASPAPALAATAALAATSVALNLLDRLHAVHIRQHRDAAGRLDVRAGPELPDLRQLACRSAHAPRAPQPIFLLRVVVQKNVL